MVSVMSALVGAAIDRKDGDSGVKGLIAGTVAASAVRLAVPMIATYAIGWAVIYGVQRMARASFVGPVDGIDDSGRD